MSNPLFDALGLNEAAGIDDNEVEAIKRVLDRIKVEAAQVAKINDSATTIEILNTMVAIVRKVGNVTSSDELHQVLATLGHGTTTAVAPAIAGGSAPTLSDNEQRLVDLFRSAGTGQQQAIIRIMSTADPARIRVDSTGTPVMIPQLQQAWDDDHDVNHAGSQAEKIHDLQQQLVAARALPSGVAMVPQTELDAANTKLATLKTDVQTEVAKLKLNDAESAGFGGRRTTLVVAPTVVRSVAAELHGLTR